MRKVNGCYKSIINACDRRDYNVDVWDNIMYLRWIIQLLKGEGTEDDRRKMINQLQERILNIVDETKNEAAPPWLRSDYKFDKKELK